MGDTDSPCGLTHYYGDGRGPSRSRGGDHPLGRRPLRRLPLARQPAAGPSARRARSRRHLHRRRGHRAHHAAGRRYLDFAGAYGALPFGHNDPEVWGRGPGRAGHRRAELRAALGARGRRRAGRAVGRRPGPGRARPGHVHQQRDRGRRGGPQAGPLGHRAPAGAGHRRRVSTARPSAPCRPPPARLPGGLRRPGPALRLGALRRRRGHARAGGGGPRGRRRHHRRAGPGRGRGARAAPGYLAGLRELCDESGPCWCSTRCRPGWAAPVRCSGATTTASRPTC